MNIVELLKVNKKRILMGLTLVVVLIFIFIMFKSYKIAKNRENIDDLPLIESKVENIKIRQETKELDNNTNSFYEAFDRSGQNKKKLKEINIIEAREDIIEDEYDGNGYNNSEQNVSRIELNNGEEVIINNVEKTSQQKEKNNIQTNRTENIKEVIINEKKDEKLDNKNKYNSIENVNNTFYRVQLVALKNKQQAVIFTEKTKRRFSGILKNLELFITEINLDEKGIFYRVQVGNFNTRNGAVSFCEEYKKIATDKDLTSCIVVK